MRRRPTKAELKLARENDELRTTIEYVGRLQYLLQKRTEQIDTLNAKIEQLRNQNKRLDAEADLLIAMIEIAPPPPL